jgi:clathrin heavy chain
VLRTPDTIARFQAAPAAPGQPTPILTYFGMLLEKGKLNSMESLELAKPVIQQGKQNLLQKWVGDDKLECSEELGDMVKMDANLALSIYLKAKASPKVIQSFMETGQFDKIMTYCQMANYTADWGFLLTNIVRVNPAGALDFAQKLAASPQANLNYTVVADVFVSHNCLQQATSFLLDVLKGNKPEEADLQTRLLEMNLMAAPQVADAIMANEMFTHYDKPRIAMLSEKAGLVQRALEHYEHIDDLKRVMSSVRIIARLMSSMFS